MDDALVVDIDDDFRVFERFAAGVYGDCSDKRPMRRVEDLEIAQSRICGMRVAGSQGSSDKDQ